MFKHVVGVNAFDSAVTSVREKFTKKDSYDPSAAEAGTLEKMLGRQIEKFESSMQGNLDILVQISKRAEMTFQDKLDEAASQI